MKVYTRSGDKGQTSLWNGERLSKNQAHIRLLGDIDELTSALGVARSHLTDENMKKEIKLIQEQLVLVMGEIAKHETSIGKITMVHVKRIENAIDNYQNRSLKHETFITPGDYQKSAFLDLARTVARRAERQLYEVDQNDEISDRIKQFINRLSDLLYTMARYNDFIEEVEEKVKQQLSNREVKLVKQHVLNLNKATELIRIVEYEAEKRGIPVVIAVSNSAGHTIAVHSMDHALIASFELAVNKAFTAVAVKMSTEKLGELSNPKQPLYGIQFSNNGRIVNFGGGIPLFQGNELVGGIGVSGGSAHQDIELAELGARVFKEGGI
ncbi:cob(I)yrinic acid a,c-diamide adenosyltransferase [Vallitalea okinawensis]|uniref:cob(I)yrinic acid a,c-diamide adenosyltransferase n=1 Tax=Vallitalea okinawensis TaxID=2078660 RepID=UPI000CFB8619|nr:cob(I)yrinic acid a,c-diamide adenosyltransferase [Vallitalea okinawensis]